MKFALRVDEDDARSLAPDLTAASSYVEITDSELEIHVGQELETSTPLSLVTSAEQLDDPRPEVFLPLGVSAAVEQLGRDTVSAVGAYDGLVAVRFREPIEADVRPIDYSPGDDVVPDASKVTFQRLVLSVENPAEFVQAINQHGKGERQEDPSATA